MSAALPTVAEAQKMESYIVAKANEFILHSRYDLSTMEQRIIACMISMPAELKAHINLKKCWSG